MGYKVKFEKAALHHLKKLPVKTKIHACKLINSLSENPRPPSCNKLQGIKTYYRVRTGNYRVIYTIEDDIITVTIIKIVARKNIFRNL